MSANNNRGFPPFYGENPRILILGSFPSVISRREGFYYGNKNNRFWRVLSSVFGQPLPETEAEKRDMLSRCGIALWDIADECTVDGSADSTITEVIPNDVLSLIKKAGIKHIYINGRKAEALFNEFCRDVLPDVTVTYLPSTSPANAAYGIDKLIKIWSVIKNEADT